MGKDGDPMIAWAVIAVLLLIGVVAWWLWTRAVDQRRMVAMKRAELEARIALARQYAESVGACTYPECVCSVPCDAEIVARR
jgi:ABC-type nickel/cobalt efflux system permease component RcnA